MLIEYADDDLRRLAEDSGFRVKRWGPDVTKAYRKKIQLIGSALDERDLLALRSLNLEKLKGDRADQCSIRLNDQFRLILTFRTEPDGRVAVVLEITDYH